MRVTARRNTVIIPTAGCPAVYLLANRLPGYHKFKDDDLVFEITGANLDVFREVFPNVEIDDQDGSLARHALRPAPIAPYARKAISRMRPFAHQDHAIDVALSRDFYGFFHGLGLGKTKTMIEIAIELFLAGKIRRALLVTRGRAIPQVLTEQLPLHLPESFPVSVVTLLSIGKLPKAVAKDWEFPRGRLLILVVASSAFQSKKQAAAIREFCGAAPTVGLIDESADFKNWSSARTDNLLKLVDVLPYRYLFTGEPKPLGYIDLFSQFYFLNPDIIGHSGITSFRAQYCRMMSIGDHVEKIAEYLHVDTLMEKVAPHCEFVAITDCIDMPERTYQELRFTPTKEQVQVYARLKREFVIEVECAIDEKDVELRRRICVNAVSKVSAMRQVANGFFYENPIIDANGDVQHGDMIVLNDERALFTIESLLDAPKAIIWAAYHGDLDSIARALAQFGVEGVEFSGRVDDKQAEINKQRFIHDPRCKFFYGTTASGGTALDGLQVCHHMAFFSNTYNYGDRAQAEGRIWRTGQHEPCIYYDILGFPIDRLVLANIQEKKNMSVEMRALATLAEMKGKL